MKDQLERWMDSQGDQRIIFNQPHLLSDATSTRHGENADKDVLPAGM